MLLGGVVDQEDAARPGKRYHHNIVVSWHISRPVWSYLPLPLQSFAKAFHVDDGKTIEPRTSAANLLPL